MTFSLSSMYNATFDGTGFLELYDSGFGQPAPAGGEDYTVYHFPGGDNSLVVLSGATVRKTEIAIGATSSDIATLKGKEGDSGSLVYSVGTFTARLIRVREHRKGGTGAGGDKATLEFIIP